MSVVFLFYFLFFNLDLIYWEYEIFVLLLKAEGWVSVFIFKLEQNLQNILTEDC